MYLFNNLINLLSTLNGYESIPFKFCELMKVPVNKSSIKKDLEEHPDYPSLLTISDVLKKYGIGNLSAKINISEVYKLTQPFISHVKIDGKEYFVITSVKLNYIFYLHPITNEQIKETINNFDKIFTGVILIGERSEVFGEKNYKKNRLIERKKVFSNLLAILTFPIIAIFVCLSILFKEGMQSILVIIYFLLYLIGAFVGILLLWHEIDSHNPTLQKICSSGKKVNCSAILHSKASKIFGISWSVIGFTYFAGSFLALLLVNLHHLPTLTILSWLAIFAIPYIVYSIYYQGKIAQQWCVLCLIIQSIFFLQFIIVLLGGWYANVFQSQIAFFDILRVTLFFIIPFFIISILLPALQKAKESRGGKMELLRLKHNPQIFQGLLSKQKEITESTEGIGITLGKTDARYKLIKVCNPYCGPCIAAHPIIEELIENNPEIQLQIIFSSFDNEYEPGAKPAKHLLAIHEKGNSSEIKQALNDWYMPDEMDYTAFATKYPLNQELQNQGEKMKAMRRWCDKTEIDFTPTFFLNGHQLPQIYSVHDLKYFLSV